ncbi:MAG: argininosuccinate lyase [Nitrososphaerales archaeon]
MANGIYRSRLSKDVNKNVLNFLSSMREDARFFEEDILGTEAHVIMLGEQKIIPKEDLKKIVTSLEKIRKKYGQGKLPLNTQHEDVHEFIEDQVILNIGISSGGRMHTARSRNDQVALDLRLRLRNELNELSIKLLSTIEEIIKRADRERETVMALYTHGQQAQIGLLSHYLLGYADALLRDLGRISDSYGRVNLCPLGSSAIGGTSFPIDRRRVSDLLGFDGLLENSMDAVTSRDFIIETLAVLAILMSGLSRMTEDLIQWSTAEFGYIEVGDAYASVSSVLPQKKNPDTLEMVRGRTGNLIAALVATLTIVKGLPSGYNRDLQQTKPPLFFSLDGASASLDIMRGVIKTMKVNKTAIQKQVKSSYALAPDLADFLTRKKGLPFRQAHQVVGQAVKQLSGKGKDMSKLDPSSISALSKKLTGKSVNLTKKELQSILDVKSSLKARVSQGGSSPEEDKRMSNERKILLVALTKEVNSRVKEVQASSKALQTAVSKIIGSKR